MTIVTRTHFAVCAPLLRPAIDPMVRISIWQPTLGILLVVRQLRMTGSRTRVLIWFWPRLRIMSMYGKQRDD